MTHTTVYKTQCDNFDKCNTYFVVKESLSGGSTPDKPDSCKLV